MAEEVPLQKKRTFKADLWWIVGTGLILAAANAWVVFQAASTVQPYANHLDLSLNKGDENLTTVYLLYFLLFGLIIFLAGLLRGWVAGKADASLLTSLEASLFGGTLAFAVLPLIWSLVIAGEIMVIVSRAQDGIWQRH